MNNIKIVVIAALTPLLAAPTTKAASEELENMVRNTPQAVTVSQTQSDYDKIKNELFIMWRNSLNNHKPLTNSSYLPFAERLAGMYDGLVFDKRYFERPENTLKVMDLGDKIVLDYTIFESGDKREVTYWMTNEKAEKVEFLNGVKQAGETHYRK